MHYAASRLPFVVFARVQPPPIIKHRLAATSVVWICRVKRLALISARAKRIEISYIVYIDIWKPKIRVQT